MQQAWVQVAGLCIDFIGVTLIALEWLLAQRQDRRLQHVAADLERQGASYEQMRRLNRERAGPGSAQMERHFEFVEKAQAQAARVRSDTTRQDFTRMRTTVVGLGMVLVLIGFVLQVLGTVPGCCPALGIVG